MALPRPVFPDRTYLITRRCTQRQFLLRPDPETNRAALYCLAEAADQLGIRLLFTMFCGNHHHSGIDDPNANYPAFLERFHRHLAKCQNARFGRWENMWASEQTSVVRLVEAHDVLDKMVYALTNPVKDHLVERAHHWPGASSLAQNLSGRELVVARPTVFFDPLGLMPETVTVKFHRPPGFEHLPQEQFAEVLRAAIAEVEHKAAEQRRVEGRNVLGRKAVRAQSWRDRPGSAEPRRQMSPRVAARSKWARIESLQRLQSFIEAYRAARAAFRGGRRDVVFPAGTYWLRVFVAVRCGPWPQA